MTYWQAKAVLVAAAIIALASCSASAATADGAAAGGASTPAATTPAASATSPAASTPAASATSPAAAAGGSGSFKAACPSTATVAAATGVNYPAPKQTNGGGELTCSYNNSNDVLVVGFTSYAAATGNDVKLAMDSQAKAQGVSDHAIPGLGTAAYGFTTNGTTIIEMLVGSEIVVVTGISTSAAGVQTLARDIAG
jgi:hypothetical protein